MTSRSHGAWQESSVAKFGAVHKKLKEEGKDETTRGASLRELQRFFEEHDKDKGYAGMRRIADDDGTAMWTILNETEVAVELEKRAEERQHKKEEEEIGAAPELALANRELERLKAENEKLVDAAKNKWCGLFGVLC